MALVKGVPFSELPRAKRHAIFVAQRKQRATPAENVFSSYLASLGLSYCFQRGFYRPCYRIADFYIPSLKLIIEIDGPCHDRENDAGRDAWFERARGITTIRLTNDQVLNGDYAAISTILARMGARDPLTP